MANNRTTIQMNMDYVRAKLFTIHTVESLNQMSVLIAFAMCACVDVGVYLYICLRKRVERDNHNNRSRIDKYYLRYCRM